jgi:hypothetical protein
MALAGWIETEGRGEMSREMLGFAGERNMRIEERWS